MRYPERTLPGGASAPPQGYLMASSVPLPAQPTGHDGCDAVAMAILEWDGPDGWTFSAHLYEGRLRWKAWRVT